MKLARNLYRWALAAVAVLAVTLPAPSLVYADEAPAYPTTTRQYYVQGLDKYPDYSFVIVHERDRRQQPQIHVLNNGEQIPTSTWRWGSESTLYAVKADLPEEVTTRWLAEADALSVVCTLSLARTIRSPGDNPRITLEKVTYQLRIPSKDEKEEDKEAPDKQQPSEQAEGDDEAEEAEPPRQLDQRRLQIVGQLDGPLHLVPARLVRLNRDQEVLLDLDLLAADAGTKGANATKSTAATTTGVLLLTSGFGVLLLLGIFFLRRVRD